MFDQLFKQLAQLCPASAHPDRWLFYQLKYAVYCLERPSSSQVYRRLARTCKRGHMAECFIDFVASIGSSFINSNPSRIAVNSCSQNSLPIESRHVCQSHSCTVRALICPRRSSLPPSNQFSPKTTELMK